MRSILTNKSLNVVKSFILFVGIFGSIILSNSVSAQENQCILQTIHDKFTAEKNLSEFRVKDIVDLIDNIRENTDSRISKIHSKTLRKVSNANLSHCAGTDNLQLNKVSIQLQHPPNLHMRFLPLVDQVYTSLRIQHTSLIYTFSQKYSDEFFSSPLTPYFAFCFACVCLYCSVYLAGPCYRNEVTTAQMRSSVLHR